MPTIIDNLSMEHARFRRYLGWYRDEIDKLSRGEKPDYILLDMLARYFAQYPDELHHRKEDVIFAYLEKQPSDEAAPHIDLHEQHIALSMKAQRFAEIVGRVLNEQELAIDRIVEEASEYASGLIEHMHEEEAALFEPARARLSANDWARINEQICEIYVNSVNAEKARQVLTLESEIDAYKQ